MSGAGSARSLWRTPGFALLWSGQFVSALGTKVSGLALPLLVLAITGSPAQAGFLASARMLPYLVLGLPAGALVDRWDRRTVLIVCDVVRGVALGSVPLAWAMGHLTLIQLYAVALTQGSAFVFFNVAEYAALSELVEPSDLPAATALDSTAWSTASLVGPGLAGTIIGAARSTAAGAALGFLVDSVTFFGSVFSLLFLRLRPSERTVPKGKPPLLADIGSGLRFVLKSRTLSVLAGSAAFLSFIYAPVSLAMIVVARSEMRLSPSAIGVIFSVAASGGIVGSLIAPRIAQRFTIRQVLCASVAVQALATLVVALAPSAIILCAGWTVAFLLDPVLSTSATSYRLKITPPELQARVQSIFRLGTYGGDPLGSAVGGLLIVAIGARAEITWVAGAVAVCSGALWLGLRSHSAPEHGSLDLRPRSQTECASTGDP